MRFILIGLIFLTGVTVLVAAPLTQSTFTEIIQHVDVVAAADKTVTPARTNEVFRSPDVVRTGENSRLEMTAPDQTVTRVGANTVFTFETGGRDIRLFRGSVLFHPPAGVGGGTVRYGGTAAAVLGTTMICAVLPDGSFKIMLLEGKATVKLANGQSIELKAGQMVIVPPAGDRFGPVLDVDLARLVYHLLLVVGFSNSLSSMPLITEAIRLQNEQIVAGTLDHFVDISLATSGLDVIGIDLNFPLNVQDHTTIFISPD